MINLKDERLKGIRQKANELSKLIADFENEEPNYLITARIATSDGLDKQSNWIRKASPVLTLKSKTELDF